MIGKLIGAFVGSKLAKQSRGIGGPAGAALGVAAPMLLRRISLPTMLMLGGAGYLGKKLFDRAEADKRAGGTSYTGATSDRAEAPTIPATPKTAPAATV
jgi:hypothetical protein